MAKLPNFVVVGAPKSGTTSLYFYLLKHPEIYLPQQKELHFFSYQYLRQTVAGPQDADILDNLCSSFNEYTAHYSQVKDEKAIGEISPSYLYYEVQEKLKAKLGNVKIIILLRNPIEKAYSQYMHLVRDQREKTSFLNALQLEDKRKRDNWSDIWLYAQSSLYSRKVAGYIDCFGRENVKVFLFEEFTADVDQSMQDIYEFLGLENFESPEYSNVYNRSGLVKSAAISYFLNNDSRLKRFVKSVTPDLLRVKLRLRLQDINTNAKPEIDPESRDFLFNYFRSDISNLGSIIEKDLSGWTVK